MLYYIFHYAVFVDIFFIVASMIACHLTFKKMANGKFYRYGELVTFAEVYDEATLHRFFLIDRTPYYYASLTSEISWCLLLVTAFMWDLTI